MFFFGPESERPVQEVREPVLRPSSSHRPPSPEPTSLQVPRKRPGENGPNGIGELTPQPAIKRSRKAASSTGAERNGARKTSAPPLTTSDAAPINTDVTNGQAPAVLDTRSPSPTEGAEENGTIVNGFRPEDRMDVDTDGELPPETSIEPLPPIVNTLTSGDSIGIQVAPAKIADLVPSTTIIDAPNDRHLTQTSFSPHEQSILTSRGDYTCGVWRTLNSALGKPSFHELLNYRDADESLVTALAWEPTGSMLAIATYTQGFGGLHLFDGRSLDLLETLPASQRAILRLQFQKAGFRLVGLAPFDDDSAASSILFWDLSNGLSSAEPFSVTVPETLEDIDCALFDGNGVACAVGGQAVYQCRAFTELEVEQKWTSIMFPGNDRWAFVKCSWRSPNDSLLVVASSESGRIWLPSKDIKKSDAHQAAITGLQIRPATTAGVGQLSTSEFATSSEDGTIKVWQVNQARESIDQLAKLTFGRPILLKTLAYSPDGFCLAGASHAVVRIWNAEHGYNQMAIWQGPGEWKGNSLRDEDLMSNGAMSSINGDGNGGALDYSLSWDLDSKKLAFGLGSQVSLPLMPCMITDLHVSDCFDQLSAVRPKDVSATPDTRL